MFKKKQIKMIHNKDMKELIHESSTNVENCQDNWESHLATGAEKI